MSYDEELTTKDSTMSVQRLLNVKKHPVVDNKDFFSCCNSLSLNLLEFQKCKYQMISYLESKKNLIDTSWGQDYCYTNKGTVNTLVNSRRRRHLMQIETGNISVMSLKTYSNITNMNFTEQLFLSSIFNDNSAWVKLDDSFMLIDNEDVCHTGTFKEARGNGPCMICPSGTSTVYPYTGIASKSSCACLPGFYAVRDTNNISLLYCLPCGFGMHRPPYSQNDSTCFQCPVNTFTPTISSAYCYCKPGYYRSDFNSPCKPCMLEESPSTHVSFYCVDDQQYFCPPNSLAPPLSFKRVQCMCNETTHYGSLESKDSQCISKPPGLSCTVQPGRGVVGCICLAGWIMNDAGKCVTSCKQGQYAVTLSNTDDSITECLNCPLGKYSENPQIFSVNSCIQCPKNTFTRQTGSTSIDQCVCPSSSIVIDKEQNAIPKNNSGLSCDTCPQNMYLNISSHVQDNRCLSCPQGMTSEKGSVGLQSCMCPPGKRAVITYWVSGTLICESCPKGFFSSKIGSTCISCPRGYTTEDIGSTSLRQCSIISNEVYFWNSFF
jgi:hypothetical protein